MYTLFSNPDGRADLTDIASVKMSDLNALVSEVHRRLGEGEHLDDQWVKRVHVKAQQPETLDASPDTAKEFGSYLDFSCLQNQDSQRESLLQGSDQVRAFELTGNATEHGRNWENNPYPGFAYWYVAPGECPNLRSSEACSTKRCTEDGACALKPVGGELHETCLRDSGGDFVRGAVCPEGVTTPTGQPGCVAVVDYTAKPVSLAVIMGVTEELCDGGRKCNGTRDFRETCRNNDYKRVFKGVNPGPSLTCSLYGLHPYCRQGCFTAGCLRVPRKQVEWTFAHQEIGLPFWQGRCDMAANRMRVEAFAEALGVEAAVAKHQIAAPEVTSAMCSTCASPDAATGGLYCTRHYSSTCTPCYIPGTLRPVFHSAPLSERYPVCPLNILTTTPYDVRPECATTNAKDGCCLYTGACDGSLTPHAAPLDASGLALIGALQSDFEMGEYLKRMCSEKDGHELRNVEHLADFSHTLWNQWPLFLDFDAVDRELVKRHCPSQVELLSSKFALRWIVYLSGAFGLLLGLFTYFYGRKFQTRDSATYRRGETELSEVSFTSS
jgi:hypothetical protein